MPRALRLLLPPIPELLGRVPREAHRYTVGEVLAELRRAYDAGELR